ncbi:MAG: LacI family DNA-binding transcriptional regulator, partial [Candidatus Bipolaricaulota bacterium]
MTLETKARVLKAIEELDYTPVKAARVLRRQRTQLIGVLLPDISNPFFSLMARGVEGAAFEEGYSTLICDSNHSVEKEARYLELLLAEGVEGVVFVPVGRPDRARIERLLKRGIRIVAADRRAEGLPSVQADNIGGSRAVTRHVLHLGYGRIAYIAGPPGVSTADDRLRGFSEVMASAGLEAVATLRGDYTYESGYELGLQVLRDDEAVDAILCGNDLMAIGALQAARIAGRLVPSSLGVAGFDHIPLFGLLQPALTTVETPVKRLGQVAAESLLRGAEGGKTLPVSVVKGNTCVERR